MTKTDPQEKPAPVADPGLSTRVGAISFVNTIPIYSAYQPVEGSTLHYDVPAALNARVRRGALEVSPVSSACYLREKDRLVLLEDLSVSSWGAVESVIFLSRTPLGPELLAHPCINIPNDSETSVMLLAYLLREATGENFQERFRLYEAARYEETLITHGNALIIGDRALMVQAALAEKRLTGFHCYDLSTLWKEKTGLPFVFAVWVADRQWAGQAPAQLRRVNRALCDARDRFYGEPVAFEAGLQLAQQKSGLPRETLERYYRQCLDYRLEKAHRQSLALFEDILQWFDRPAHTCPAREEALTGSL
jgi:chorismate dehydratase